MGALKLSDLGYTYADYAAWPGDWELIEGVPVPMSPAPTLKHQHIAGEILFQFRNQLEKCQQCQVLHEVDWKLSEETVLRPDVVVTCKRQHEQYLLHAPEIVVEVVSPSTVRRDEGVKRQLYEQEKVLYYVLAYPEDGRAKIFQLRDRTYDKLGDFMEETARFDQLPCPLALDFERVFSSLQAPPD